MKVDIKSVCIASSLKLLCLDRTNCGHVDYSRPPQAADVPSGLGKSDNRRKRMTDHAINCLYVLSFLGSGDGGKEAVRLLSLMGLPNHTTMESRSFGIIEDRIGIVIRELLDEILQENLVDEVKAAMEASPDYTDNDFFFGSMLCTTRTFNWIDQLIQGLHAQPTLAVYSVQGILGLVQRRKGRQRSGT